MKLRYLLPIILAFCSLKGLAQVATVEFSGNLNPTVNSTVTYTAIFRNSSGNLITNPSGSGGFDLMTRTLGTVVSSDSYSITINWTSPGGAILEFGFYDTHGNHVSKELIIDVQVGGTPPAPVAMSASSRTTTSFVANWDASVSATSYTLEISLASNFSSIFRTYSGLTTLNQVVTSLTPSTTYYYRVRAYNNGNASPSSYVIIGRTLPVAPTGLTTTNVSETSFTVSWAASTGAYGYELDVSNDNFATFVTGYNRLTVNGTTKTVAGLAGSTTYKWRVRTLSSTYEESANSAVQTVSTLSPTMLNPDIAGFTNITATSFQVNWISVIGATSYQIEVSENSGFSSYVGSYNSSATPPSYVVQHLTAGTLYYVRVRAVNASQTSGYSPPASISTAPGAPVATTASNAASQSFQANWQTVPSAISYQLDIATNDAFNPILTTVNNITNNSYTITGLTQKTSYYYRVRAISSSGTSTNSNTVFALNFDHNYICSIDVLVSGKKTLSAVNSLSLNERKTVYQFFDGLGRPVQTVLMKGSPLQKDIITPIDYDVYGREAKKYLPYVDPSENNGWYKENALREIASSGSEQNQYRTGRQYFFYQLGGTVPFDQYPYAETKFEPSPTMRSLEQGAPGLTWQPDATDGYTSTDHTVKFSFEINLANDEVLLWKYVEPTASIALGLINTGSGATPQHYPVNTLFKNRTKDEHQNEVIEYKDKEGKVILKKVQVIDNEYTNTYYIYDDFGNLVCVLPPEAVKGITKSPSEYHSQPEEVKDSFLKLWAFRYRYDHRNRLIEKQVPGAEKVLMVYDKRDRLVLTQDGVQRPKNEWTYTKYDVLNRPVVTGIWTNEDNVDVRNAVDAQTVYHETSNTAESDYSFANTFPTDADREKILSVTYYDNYDFLGKTYFDAENLDYSFTANDIVEAEDRYPNSRGLVTATKTKVLGKDKWLNTVSYYDDKNRVIQTISENYLGGQDRISTEYDFVGKVMRTKQEHTGKQPLLVYQRFEYDHAGRVMVQRQRIGEDPNKEVILAVNEYNELGQLIDKRIGIKLDGNGTVTKGPIQSIDYRYNIRGWLTNINRSDLGNDQGETNDDDDDKFGMELLYENIESLIPKR